MSNSSTLIEREISQDEVDMIFGWELLKKLPKITTKKTDPLFQITALKDTVSLLNHTLKHTSETVLITDFALHLPYPSLFGMIGDIGFSITPRLAAKLFAHITELQDNPKPLNFTDMEISLLQSHFEDEISQNFSVLGELWEHAAIEITCYNEALTLYKPTSPPDYAVILTEIDVDHDDLNVGSTFSFSLQNRQDVHFMQGENLVKATLKTDENGAFIRLKGE